MDAKRCISGVWALACLIFFSGCQQPPPLPTPQPSECSPEDVEIIWPELQAVQPEQVAPGAEIKIIGSGGFQIECGDFYNESHRLFTVYFNQDQVGMLSCMVNHCEGMILLPEDLQPGVYKISTEGGSQIEIEIIEGQSFEFLNWDEKFPASAKGYEIYSWFDEDRWHYTLVSGTNRSKTIAEILSPESKITQDEWVKITVTGVQALKSVLNNLPGSQEIFWLDGARLEGTGWDEKFGFPPEEIILQVRQHSDELGLKLHIIQ